MFCSCVQAEVQSVSSVAPINAWAEKVTNGMIKQVVPPGLPFNMIITNAVYFKGLWEYAFDKTSTRKQNFNAVTSSGERKVRQPMQWEPACMGWHVDIQAETCQSYDPGSYYLQLRCRTMYVMLRVLVDAVC
jgi:hypothetical protein